MCIDPVLKLLRYPYGYYLIPRIELIQNRTYRDQSKKVRCFAQQLFFNKNDFLKMVSGPKWTFNGA